MILNRKRADYKWDLIIILLLGLAVLGIVLFFIFEEYFNQDDIDIESCRQSIILRNNIPEFDVAGLGVLEFKSQYPLRCKTQVIEIDYNDTARAEREIMETIAGCWFLFGNGKYQIFPSSIWSFGDSYCVPCARIHIDLKNRAYYDIDKNKIDISRALSSYSFKGHSSYEEYFRDVGYPFLKFTWSDSFRIEETSSASKIYMPRFFDVERGDLIIIHNSVIAKQYDDSRKDLSSILFFQDDGGKSLKELDRAIVSSSIFGFRFEILKICKYWDGIPA
jgi:hypothetical protein